MKKVRKALVIVRDDAYSNMTWSGIPNHTIKILRDHGVEVEVVDKLGFPNNFSWRVKRALNKIINTPAPRYYSVSTSKFYGKLLEKRLNPLKNDFDFVLAIDFTEGMPFFEKNQKPTFVFRDASYLQLNEIKYPGYENFSVEERQELQKVENEGFKTCDRVLITSNWAKKYCQKFHPDIEENKYFVLPFSSQIYPPPVRHDWKLRSLDNTSVVKFLFVGRDWKRKGGDKAVEILNCLSGLGKKIQLTIVGANPSLQDVKFEYQVIQNLDMNSDVDKRRMIELYKENHFFILPVNIEAFGIVFSEAMSFGLPIITHDTCALPEIIENDIHGICLSPNTSSMDFARRALVVIDNNKRYQEIQEACYQRFSERFHPRNWVEGLLSLIE